MGGGVRGRGEMQWNERGDGCDSLVGQRDED